MTVYCLTDVQKGLVADWYQHKIYSQKEIAKQFHVSQRTINRVLEEKGLATPVARIKGEAHQLVTLVRSYGLTNADLDLLLKTVGTSVPLAQASRDILKIVRERGMTPEQLKAALAAPALTYEIVQTYLDKADRHTLSQLFYRSALIKVAEMAKERFQKTKEEGLNAAVPQ